MLPVPTAYCYCRLLEAGSGWWWLAVAGGGWWWLAAPTAKSWYTSIAEACSELDGPSVDSSSNTLRGNVPHEAGTPPGAASSSASVRQPGGPNIYTMIDGGWWGWWMVDGDSQAMVPQMREWWQVARTVCVFPEPVCP